MSDRGMWGSRFGFVLAAAGSAVGLGNIWGFPTQVGQGGGAAFVLLYLACIAFICFPILIAELALGRRTQTDPVGAFRAVRPNSKWWLAGAMFVAAGVGILSFYAVIAGWTLAYIWFAGTGAAGSSAEEIGAFFTEFTASGPVNLFLTFVIMAVTGSVLLGGVRSGIERMTKLMMPLLIGLLLLLAARALTLPGAAEGLTYYLRPDFSRIFDIRVINAALGQAFFSLSLGMGTMLVYGSYLTRREGIAQAALMVVALDTAIALLAGFIIFPSGFSIPGFDPSASGPGLIFVVLPRLFATLPGGNLFGAAFFILLTMAALTSAVSLLEVPVAHFIDAHGWPRRKAVVVVTLGTFCLAAPSALANGASGFFSQLPVIGIDFQTLMITMWNNFALPIGGFLTAIFVGYVWRIDNALEELRAEQAWFPDSRLWGNLIRYACPVAIFLILFVTVQSMIG
ncbi:MAG: sodium-dependent transporter [Vicinamibacterales bacterium]|nr:sodium-dependent transporter [Vicinamibacterales bacterium]HJO39308.1 sodium-dependent transporter [Vicinamibacterales bacterium]